MEVRLPFGNAPVPVEDLVAEIFCRGGFMIVGPANVVYDKHPKPHGLDMWLRSRASGGYRNVRQATKEFLDTLCQTGLFTLACDPDPQTGKVCNSIRLGAEARQLQKGQGFPIRIDQGAIRARVEQMDVNEIKTTIVNERVRTALARRRYHLYDSERGKRIRMARAYLHLYMVRRLRRLGQMEEVVREAKSRAEDEFKLARDRDTDLLRLTFSPSDPDYVRNAHRVMDDEPDFAEARDPSARAGIGALPS